MPGGLLEYEVVAPQQWEGWGNAAVSVIVRQGERVVQNIPVRVEVEALAEMVVAVRQIDHGSVLSVDDLALRKQDLAGVKGRFLRRIEDAAGKKVRTTLRANSPLRADQLEKVPLVKTGQMVTIVAENERMRITVTGKAKSAGAEGDTITVQNLNSLKELPARVIDAGTVRIVF
jgi:flagella basal body P-ring formation protein FlgA